ncbi:zeta toxin family protein [Smaragdicoccus niigatensis]|uniref:zeta toxin family protein n=1 Tax=Smaragdicoccus niigatensis TaxID=359359 RepID=UPI00036C1F75|nr:zeta toxin family protein [Smaragdicoccus niigatensis]
MKRLDLVIGSNGAGKTTFVTTTLKQVLPGSVFVNADEIAKQRWPADPEAHSYEAAEIAANTRNRLIDSGVSFIAETVFSHPSKLALIGDAQAKDYRVILHVLMVPEELTVLRVHYRVQAGGHNVPENKIRERYQRVWHLAAAAMLRSDTATLYDSSSLAGPRAVATFSSGIATWVGQCPAWTPAPLKRVLG